MPLKTRKPSIVYWLGNNLYLNITNRCLNNCFFCFRNFTHNLKGFNLKLKQKPSPEEVITELQKVINRKNWDEIVFCGFGEPLERLDCIIKVTEWIKKYSGKIVRIDTNGQGFLLNKKRAVVEELKEAGVDKISVSLNAQDRPTYIQVCRPNFEDAYDSILEFIKKSSKEFDLEITAVTVPEVDLLKMQEMAKEMGVKFRIRRFIPCFW
jgi:TatD DNase family protein